MKPGVMLVNTGRGALIDTLAVIEGLKSGRIGSLALDVYEEEAELFFEDRSAEVLRDDVFARLLTFPNVLITAHQAFLTNEALAAIAETTIANLDDLASGRRCPNQLVAGLSPDAPAPERCSTLVVVGKGRFELPTPCSQSRCATRLRHFP